MCGFAAFVGGSFRTDRLLLAAETLENRGPDEVEVFQHPGVCGLVARRLRITDTSVSWDKVQQTHDEVWVAFNGEIWNAQELRVEFGLSTSSSATELGLLRCLYDLLGEKMFARLSGMFAIMVLDFRRRLVVAARDHCGIKPLFYVRDDEGMKFASTIAALVAMGHRPRFNWDFAANMATFGFTDYDNYMLEGVQQVAPGHTLTASIDAPDNPSNTYIWSESPDAPSGLSLQETLLGAASDCISHTDSDRVGLLLSGGVDSSLLAVYLKQVANGREIVTFTLRDKYEEDLRLASSVAKYLGLESKVIDVDDVQFRLSLPRTLTTMSGYYFPAIHAMFRAIRAAAPDLRVLICGEGADELFGGYSWFKSPANHLANLHAKAQALRTPTKLRDEIQEFASPDRHADPLNAVFELDRGYPLSDRHLLPLDHGSMDSSFELRVPFLHPSCWWTAIGMDPMEKMGTAGKAPLKTLLSKSGLPDAEAIANRPKIGLPKSFERVNTPASHWARRSRIGAEVVRRQREDTVLTRYAAAWFSASLDDYQSLYWRVQD